MVTSRQQVIERLGSLMMDDEEAIECLAFAGRWVWGVENQGFLGQLGALGQLLGGVRELTEGGMMGIAFTRARVLLTQSTSARWQDAAIDNVDAWRLHREMGGLGLSLQLMDNRRLGIYGNPTSGAREMAKAHELLQALVAAMGKMRREADKEREESRRIEQQKVITPKPQRVIPVAEEMRLTADEAERVAHTGLSVEFMRNGLAKVTGIEGSAVPEHIVRSRLESHKNDSLKEIRRRWSRFEPVKGSVIGSPGGDTLMAERETGVVQYRRSAEGVTRQAPGGSTISGNADVTEQLLKLGEMHRNGLLTADEFAAMKKRLIGM